jgi:hypothetical protein
VVHLLKGQTKKSPGFRPGYDLEAKVIRHHPDLLADACQQIRSDPEGLTKKIGYKPRRLRRLLLEYKSRSTHL